MVLIASTGRVPGEKIGMIPDIRITHHIQLQDPLVGSPAQQPRLLAFDTALLGGGETLGKINLLGPP